jgi:D-beta-D-heptose 7-phosphate kinase/D-beta-D-heptose 1-phosphate adenosyltransferase
VNALPLARAKEFLEEARRTRILVIGDVMLDQFIWGRVARISPEAPVPVVEFERESFMPGGAANDEEVGCQYLLTHPGRPTSLKTRVIAHQQQVVRVDREANYDLDGEATQQLLRGVQRVLPSCAAVIVGDYGKGVITQPLLDQLRQWCRDRGTWLSLDPKPIHHLDLSGVSLLTPNRKEAFELAGLSDGSQKVKPLQDRSLLRACEILLTKLQPALLLITLGDQGMLLCRRGQQPFHVPTVAQEVFDVSGAGDTVIASFTLAIAAGASPIEAAVFSNHAAGVVVGKVGTAVVRPDELLASFAPRP